VEGVITIRGEPVCFDCASSSRASSKLSDCSTE